MPFADELDQFMRTGLEQLAPKTPADLPEMVEARLTTRKHHRISEISFRVTLNGATGTRFLFHADPDSGAAEQLLLGLG